MLVEAVPNFSCSGEIAKRLIAFAKSQPIGVLGSESDADHNRTVLTLAGNSEALFSAMQALMIKAVELIDLRDHKGVHPRFGALDVAPWIPLEDTPMAHCQELSRRFGEWAAERFDIPVLLYEQSATRALYQDLGKLRKDLKKNLADLQPDYGPKAPHPSAGVLITGARFFLVAFNVNLDTRDLKLARRIARALRASSGGLPAVKALAFPLDSRGQVQVSMNLCDYRQSGLADVYDVIESHCREASVTIADSELIGLIPQAAVREGLQKRIKAGFDWSDRILEGALERALPSWDFRDLTRAIGSTEPAPGGGSAAALAGALGASTLLKALRFSMTGKTSLTEVAGRRCEDWERDLQKASERLTQLCEEDRVAFSALMAAYQLRAKDAPKAERQQRRAQARQAALKSSLDIIDECEALVSFARLLLPVSNKNLINDLAVGVELTVAAAQGARWNAFANMTKDDQADRRRLSTRLAELAQCGRAFQVELKNHYQSS